jgi:hypothetical protein
MQVQSVESLRKLQETRIGEMKDSDWREAVATRDRQLQHLIEEISTLKKRITQFSDLHGTYTFLFLSLSLSLMPHSPSLTHSIVLLSACLSSNAPISPPFYHCMQWLMCV